MPEQTQDQTDQETIGSEKTPLQRGTSLLAKLRMLLFLAGVVVVECLVAYFYLPSASETAVMADALANNGSETDSPPNLDEPQDRDRKDEVEIDLGEFSVTSFKPISNSTLRIDFHLYGTVTTKEEETFQEAMAKNEHRFRDQMIVIVRSAEITDLSDAGLGLIKRKILEKTNRTLGKPLLQTVIFSDFSFIEQ